MALMKMISLGLLSSSMTLVQSQDRQTHLLAKIRNKRDADPLLDNIVGDFAKPFLNLFGGGQSNAQRKPPRKKPQQRPRPLAQYSGYQEPTYYQTPSYAPAPAAPTYTYTPPAPAPAVYQPAPQILQPEVHILPAPDLSQYSASSSYVQEPDQPALPVTYHHEEPAVAPAYEPEPVPVYQPAPPPVYEPLPPVYTPSVSAFPSEEVVKAIPLLEPDFTISTAVDTKEVPDIPKAVPAESDALFDSNSEPETLSDISDIVEIKEVPLSDIVEVEENLGLRENNNVLALDDPEDREPKAFDSDIAPTNQITNEVTQDVIDLTVSQNNNEGPIIIDLTNDRPEEDKEVLITGDEVDKKPQIITFSVSQPAPVISGPVQKSNEVISFTAQQDPTGIDFQSFVIKPVDPLPTTPTTTSTTTTSTTTTEAAVEEVVTPIAVNQELRKLIQDPEIIAVAPEDIEVIDLRGLPDSSEFSLINEDSEIVLPELVIKEEDTTDIAVTVTTTVPPSTTKTQITTTTTELSQPTTELRQITFTIQDDVEEEDDTVPETIDLTEQLVEVETLQTTSSTPVVPASINADPLFQEIVNGADADPVDTEKSKRGFVSYDPRHQAVYAHKYRDNFSNWYYFRRGY